MAAVHGAERARAEFTIDDDSFAGNLPAVEPARFPAELAQAERGEPSPVVALGAALARVGRRAQRERQHEQQHGAERHEGGAAAGAQQLVQRVQRAALGAVVGRAAVGREPAQRQRRQPRAGAPVAGAAAGAVAPLQQLQRRRARPPRAGRRPLERARQPAVVSGRGVSYQRSDERIFSLPMFAATDTGLSRMKRVVRLIRIYISRFTYFLNY